MKLVFDTMRGHELDFGIDGTRLTRTGTASEIPATAQSDPRVLLRAFEAVAQKVARTYPGTIGTRITRVVMRMAAGTNQATFAITYEGPSKLPPPSTRWVIEDSSSLTNEIEEVDITPKHFTLQAIYQPPGQQPAAAPQIDPATGQLLNFSGTGKYKPIADTVKLNVLRPRRTLSISGWIVGRPNVRVLNALGTVNAKPWGGLPIAYWLCTHISARNENAAAVPFPPQLMVYHVSAAFQSKVRRDWSHWALWKNFKGKFPKELANDPKRAAVIKAPYSIEQNHDANAFLKVGMYELTDFYSYFGI